MCTLPDRDMLGCSTTEVCVYSTRYWYVSRIQYECTLLDWGMFRGDIVEILLLAI